MLHQLEHTPKKYVLQPVEQATSTVALRSTDDSTGTNFDFTFEAVRPGIFRTTFTSPDHPLPPFPSAVRLKPNFNQKTNGVAVEPPAPSSPQSAIRLGNIKAIVEWSHAPIVSLYRDGMERPLYRDMNFRSYVADGTGIAHYSSYKKGDLYVGLGEKAAPMNLAGRGFSITASDTFGYDAYRTDPLYKHIPLLLHVTPQGCVGIFSTSHARGTWSIGSEIDGMWGHFKVYRQAYGGLEQYLLVGDTVADVVRLYAGVVGFPLLVPRYMMGYVSGGMMYSMMDEPRANEVILNFLDGCAKHDIPVSAFQMSSGYTISETPPKTRNVFTWNYHRFPDPRAFTAACHKRGVRLLANIKPYVLANHPAYEELKKKNAFFTDPRTGTTAVARLWSAGGGESGEGSHVDFTSRAGFDWWYQGCRALKAVGIDAMWNDNNEFNIFSDDWKCALETVPVPGGGAAERALPTNIGLWGRALHTELMGKSSYDACMDAVPEERPMVLTRSATAGTMKYACSSWSGDNVTSWDGMKGANALSLNAGFSLLQCYGHDIGGFEGPQPTAEHLVRWIQLGVHQPRFAINCYKTSEEDNLVGAVIEPWMHPEATPLVRAAIKRRYELIPYTYSQILRSHLTALPPMRWVGWGYEQDSEVWTKPLLDGDTQYWLGDTLLVSGVYEPGKATADVYLPKSSEGKSSGPSTAHGFLNVNAPYEWLAAGQWHTISSVWYNSIPVLARCGGAVPVGKNQPTTCRTGDAAEKAEFPNVVLDDWRGVEIYPPPTRPRFEVTDIAAGSATKFANTWLEDDGISRPGRSPIYEVRLTYATPPTDETTAPIWVHVEAAVLVPVTDKDAPAWAPLWLSQGLDVILPVGEERPVRAVAQSDGKQEQAAEDRGRDDRGRRVWHVEVDVKA